MLKEPFTNKIEEYVYSGTYLITEGAPKVKCSNYICLAPRANVILKLCCSLQVLKFDFVQGLYIVSLIFFDQYSVCDFLCPI